MPTYRYELSKTSRASCQNVTCKKEGPKIQKGELRFGNWADYGDFQGWKWKHWGCVTPLQIANIQGDIDGLDLNDDKDMEVLDGWEDLTDEAKGRIREALRVGHVADEEWKGDIEKNRPGQKGMYSSRKKKATIDELPAGDQEETPVKAKPKRKARAKKNAAADEGDETDELERDITPVPVKKGRRKKVKMEESDESAEEVMPVKKKRAPPKKRKTEEDDGDIKVEENVIHEPPSKKARGKQRAIKPEVEEDQAVKVEEDTIPQAQKKGPRSKKLKKEQGKGEPELEMENHSEDEVGLPHRTTAKKAATIKNEPTEDDDTAMADIPENQTRPAKRSRGKARKAKAEVKVEAEAEAEDEIETNAAVTSPTPEPESKPRGERESVKTEPAAKSVSKRRKTQKAATAKK